jgi:hypothetical protein
MVNATWQQRFDASTWHRYKRYDERTSTLPGDTAALVLNNYERDLRNLRDAAGREVSRGRALLNGSVGLDRSGPSSSSARSSWSGAKPTP